MKKIYCENCKHGGDVLTNFVIDYWRWCSRERHATKELNRNRNCPHYKKKWWKFWIK